MMGVATVGIGLLPTYAQVGIWAPIGLVTLRVIQGVAVGGEWGGAVLIASENAPKGKSILYSAFAQQGSPRRKSVGHDRVLPSVLDADAVVPPVRMAHPVHHLGGAGPFSG